MSNPNQPDYRIVPFGMGILPNCEDITALHLRLLPISVVSNLGPYFMKHFFYGVLPKNDYLFGAVSYVNGVPAAFGAATANPLGFLSAAMRRHWFRLGYILSLSLLQNPTRFKAAVGAWRRKQGRGKAQAQQDETHESGQRFGELVVGGTLAEFQRASFIRSTGLQVNQDLMNHLLKECAKRGCTSMRARVSSDNPYAIVMYERLGWLRDIQGALNQGGEIIEFVRRL